MTIPEIDFPSSDLDFIKDPYPFMKDLREMSPVVLDKTTDLQLVTRSVSYTHLTLPTIYSV